MVNEIYQTLNIVNKGTRTITNQLADQITWLIASGQLKSGEKLPTIRKLAEFLKINQHTVRAAYLKLEEKHLIQTRQGAGSIVLEFNPLIHAKNTNQSLTHTVGIIVPDLGNPFYPALINGIEDVANEHNILLTTCSTRETEQRGYDYLDMLIAKHVDGLIIAPYGLRLGDVNSIESSILQSSSIPIVYVDRPDEPGNSVLLDAEGAGFSATEHLLKDHGYKRIGLITGNIKVPTLAQCYEGYKRALNTYESDFDSTMIVEVDSFSYEKGYSAVQYLVNRTDPPRAIFAAGDMLAIGALRALHDKGIRVPEDVSIIGYNDIDVADFIEPRLTTVNTPTYELGASSMQVLQRLIQGEEIEPKTITLPTKLIIRGSCGCKY